MPRVRAFAELAFLCAVVALPLQWFPAMPVEGAQLSDAGFALAALALLVALAPLAARPALARLPRFDLAVLGVFLVGVAASALVNGGSYLKLAGHVELAVIAVTAALLAQDEESAARIRLALVAAAALAAVIGLAGAALYWAGWPTGLLNHYGDLLPGDYPRIRGTCVRANMLASLLATGGVVLLAEPPRGLSRRARAGLVALICVALLFTFSRTVLTFAVGAGAVWAWRRSTRAGWIALGVSAAAAVAALFLSARYQLLLDPTRPWEASLSTAPATRWIHWNDAVATVVEHPLWGAGPGSAATADGWSAHLTWLNLWAVLGVMPLIAFVVLVGRGMAVAGRARGAVIALGVLLLDSVGRDVEDMRHLWILVGILMAARCATASRGRL